MKIEMDETQQDQYQAMAKWGAKPWWFTLSFRVIMWMSHHLVEIARPGESNRILAKYFSLRERVSTAGDIHHIGVDNVTQLHKEMKTLSDRYSDLTGKVLDSPKY